MPLTPVDCTLCENEFGRYCVPLSSQHRPAPREVLNGRVWERETIEFMRAHAGQRDIIHAGTFFGDFLPGLSKGLGPSNVIYAFEPNSESFACAQWTIAINGLTNIRLENAGLGAENRAGLMRVAYGGRAAGGASRLLPRKVAAPGDETDCIEVAIRRIDDAVPASADIGILQLDVESFEGPALLGALHTIARCRPLIILESVPQEVVDTHLKPLGYRKDAKLCDNTIFVI